MGQVAATSQVESAIHLNLLRGFELRRRGVPADVPTNVQRLLAFLAISGTPQPRTRVAGTLWLDSSEQRAGANLRTALWQARSIDDDLVTTRATQVALGPFVRIDLADTVGRATRLVAHQGLTDDFDACCVHAVYELLPEWDDDWVVFERERVRQLQLHGLEAQCRQLSRLGHHGLAVEAGLAAVAAEPLRESAQNALICAHLGEGNVVEAIRQYDSFASLLSDALGLAPSDALRELLATAP
jgi:DNA-binding SARP family transcriptional activator